MGGSSSSPFLTSRSLSIHHVAWCSCRKCGHRRGPVHAHGVRVCLQRCEASDSNGTLGESVGLGGGGAGQSRE